jgi:hypothetical protein
LGASPTPTSVLILDCSDGQSAVVCETTVIFPLCSALNCLIRSFSTCPRAMSEVKLETTLMVTGPELWLPLPPPEEHAAAADTAATAATAATDLLLTMLFMLDSLLLGLIACARRRLR